MTPKPASARQPARRLPWAATGNPGTQASNLGALLGKLGAVLLVGCTPAEPPRAAGTETTPLGASDVATRKHLEIEGISASLARAIGRELSSPPDRVGALTAYAELCESGDRIACALLSDLDHTTPVRKEAEQQLVFDPLESACRSGALAGCYLLALHLDDDLGGAPVDQSRALALFLRSCEQGFLPSCARAAEAYSTGARALERDAALKKDALLLDTCSRGIPAGCRPRPKLRHAGDPTRACTLGDIRVCRDLLMTHHSARARTTLLELRPRLRSICEAARLDRACELERVARQAE